MKKYHRVISLRFGNTVAETYLPIKVMLDENEVDKKNINYIENECRKAYDKMKDHELFEFNRVESVASDKSWKYFRSFNIKL